MSTNPQRFEQADELDLRLERIIDLASLLGTDSMDDEDWPEQLEDLDLSLRSPSCLHGRAADLLPLLLVSKSAWEVAEVLKDNLVFGLLMQVATPIRSHFSNGCFRASWGHYTTGWVYGETFDQAWEEAVSWAKKRHTEMAEKEAKGGAA